MFKTIEGSRNYIEERVSDIIWEYPAGTEFSVKIEEDRVKVLFTRSEKDL